jgi:hypothetical protein
MRSRRSHALLLTIIPSVVALMASGCGGGTKTTTTKPASTAPVAAATTTSARPSTTSAVGAGLSGKWSGQYSGAYSGTFVLNWQQSGSNLSGRITLSAPPSTLGIHGSVSGSAIKFGTVGSVAITYSGSVSGNSMSGSYQTPKGGGPWSATKG